MAQEARLYGEVLGVRLAAELLEPRPRDLAFFGRLEDVQDLTGKIEVPRRRTTFQGGNELKHIH